MKFEPTKLNVVWHSYIQHRLESHPDKMNPALIQFLTASQVDFMDMEVCEYGEWGDIRVRYLDFLYGEEEVEIRRISSVTDSFAPTWGYMHMKAAKHFDHWLLTKFECSEQDQIQVLDWIDTFLNAVLKEESRTV